MRARAVGDVLFAGLLDSLDSYCTHLACKRFQGEENCLEGLTFVITGVLESIERDDAVDLIQRYGGKVTGSLSKKTNYIVVGRDAGQSKLTKVCPTQFT